MIQINRLSTSSIRSITLLARKDYVTMLIASQYSLFNWSNGLVKNKIIRKLRILTFLAGLENGRLLKNGGRLCCSIVFNNVRKI